MKVSSLIQPPSLASQLEGKANEAIIRRVEETNQKVLQEPKSIENEANVPENVRVQHLIDLLV
jgi:hypothetical protein